MRVVHYNRGSSGGGATTSAVRLHEALLDAGVDSTLLVGTLDRTGREVVAAHLAEPDWRDDAIDTRYIRTQSAGKAMVLPRRRVDLLAQPRIRNADLLHLHYATGDVAPLDVRDVVAAGKGVVWKLPSAGPITGGCDLPGECRGFESTCTPCPILPDDPASLAAAVLADRLDALDGLPIYFLAPSEWIAARARASAVGRRISGGIEVIPNAVDTSLFRRERWPDARRALGLPGDKTVLLFGALVLNRPFKGYEPVFRALEARFAADPGLADRIELVAFGRDDHFLERFNLPIVSLGALARREDMAQAFAAADIFVAPYLEDALGNTLLESMSSRAVTLAYAAGGPAELIRDEVDGYLLPPGEAAAIVDRALAVAADPPLARSLAANARARAEDAFGPGPVLARVLDLYDRATSHARRVTVPPANPAGARRMAAARDAAVASVVGLYAMRWGEVTMPPEIRAGATARITVSFQNESNATWPAAGEHPVTFNYRWDFDGEQSPGLASAPPGVPFGVATPLPHDVGPGVALAGLTVRVDAPLLPGRYRFVADLHQQGVTWFSVKGAPTWTRTVDVLPVPRGLQRWWSRFRSAGPRDGRRPMPR